jgi:hypothetical protein
VAEVCDRPEVKLTRWLATVIYRTEGGPVDVQHDIEELDEIAMLVEAGPHWDAIDRIEIVRQGAQEGSGALTVEQAQDL